MTFGAILDSLIIAASLSAAFQVRGPSGQVRFKHPVTILLSLPNSGTTWMMTVLEAAQKNKALSGVPKGTVEQL